MDYINLFSHNFFSRRNIDSIIAKTIEGCEFPYMLTVVVLFRECRYKNELDTLNTEKIVQPNSRVIENKNMRHIVLFHQDLFKGTSHVLIAF